MTRSVLQPIRSRRITRPVQPSAYAASKASKLSPATRKTFAAIGAIWVSFATTASATPSGGHASPTPSATQVTSSTDKSKIERGRYLVEGVGLCADCHTPRTEKGEFDRSRWLLGSALAFQPTVPMPWSPAAPPIAGLPSMTEAQGVVFLTTGKRPDGSAPRPPMPDYRFSPSDATAVVAYLKSLSK